VRTRSELREQILAAARAEFAAYGLAGARIDRIARSADASKERLYAHFGDKQSLFREVVAHDGAEFFRAVTLRSDAVPEFVGGIYDLAHSYPEHLRMITWAHLEGVRLDPPSDGDRTVPDDAIAAIRTAQASGWVDPAWDPGDLLVLLFGMGLAWAHWPDLRAETNDPDRVARRRTAAVEAATRIISAPTQHSARQMRTKRDKL
jgi:AcrR family transcriptional regulator